MLSSDQKKLSRFIAAVISIAMIVCMLPIQASSAEAGKVVRVGACPDFGISKTGSVYSGFAYDYLLEIQQHTGHRYTFVEASPEELVRMLADGTIDLIPCVTEAEYQQWNEMFFTEGTRSVDYSVTPELCRSSLMKKYTAIYVSDNNPDSIRYGDTEALNKADIGYLKENQNKYFANGRYIRGDIDDANFVAYSTETQMKADFESGKIDAVLKECYRPWENESIVYQYDTKDCYFLTSGDDVTLANQLDVSVNSIMMKKSDNAYKLYQKHIEKYGIPKYAFSVAELQYAESNPKLRVAYNQQSSMLETYDSTTHKVVGLTGDILKEIGDITGLDIEVTAYSTLAECVKLLADGKVDAICGGVTKQSMARYGDFYISSPYSSAPVVLIGKPSVQFGTGMKIAVPYYGDEIVDFLNQNYTSATVMLLDNADTCMDAVKSGKADMACLCAFEAVSLINHSYDELTVLQVTSLEYKESFAYAADVDPTFATLMGKAIARLNSYEAERSRYNSLTIAQELNRVNTVPVQVIYAALILLVVLVLAGLVVILFVHRKNKRDSEIDTLTGGRNKQKFIEDVKKMMKKTSPDKWAMVMFDIDKFKFVNDRLGYQEGDRMLERIYKTLSDNMDDSELFSRISDDNFACVIRNGPDNEITTRFSNIYAEFERRNSLFVKYPVVFSAGVCRLGQCREGGKEIDINTALDRCIIAKRTMKSAHFTSIAFYDGKIRDKALREKDYENLMPVALEHREFECYLQPKYGLKSRHIEGAEALIRWNSKEFGFVFPNEFIPISEKNGFVVELDFFILEEVCRAMRRWIDDGKTPIVVSVNQSRLHLNYDDYIWRLREIVDKYEIPYEYIELELTESVFMENADRLLEIMQKLHDIGFKLSLDDFGSGYSSLNMLKDIPVDVVKIDREFFSGTVNSEKGRAVISTVVDLAANLNMEVISEGVETKEQVEFLTEINCAMVQGYYFAKPMTIAQFEELWQKDLDMRQAEDTQQTLDEM
ncbi:MAG: EAL domain-containing protein [Ruminococcaceae bacterium]|nr:EAL domain-containing protein [Oscillospiraceae bacterium]